MTAFAPRALLPAALWIGFLTACAHPKQTSQGANPPATNPGAVVTSDDIQRNPGQPVEQVLMGRFPGVVVTRVAGGIAVRIRGTTSLEGSNVPLYVLDGIIIDPGPNGSLSGINPEDIDRHQDEAPAPESSLSREPHRRLRRRAGVDLLHDELAHPAPFARPFLDRLAVMDPTVQATDRRLGGRRLE